MAAETNPHTRPVLPRALVVDDEEWARDACGQILRASGWEVAAAADGVSGLELAGQYAPDLVLVDLKMPGMDGLAYLAAIKACDPELVPVVITAYPAVAVAVEAMKAGAFDFLPKPFSPDELRRVAQRGLEHRRSAQRLAALQREGPAVPDLDLAMLAHRLKEPLAAMRQCLGVVLRGYAGQVEPPAQRMLEIVDLRGEQMYRIVNDWLTLARLEQGVGNFAPVDVAALAKAAVERLQQDPRTSALSLQLVSSGPECAVRGNAEALDELLANLLDNAVRYTPAGGTITVRVAATPTGVEVSVGDTGPGLAAAEAARVFEPFYRGQGQKSIPGTGLGLAIVKRIVEQHGGRVALQTAPGAGCTFQVLLPVQPAPTATAAPGPG